MKTWELDPDDIQLQVKIGSGSYGEVYKGLWRDLVVAIKTVPQSLDDADDLSQGELDREIAFLQTVRHPNIVLFFGGGTFHDGTTFLVTELLDSGTLGDVLQNTSNIEWALKYQFALETAKGMGHVHGLGRLHRDLKSANLLISASMHVKVADFGTASLFRLSSNRRAPSANDRLISSGTPRQTKGVGTPLWMAPEVIAGELYGYPADVFSFGIVMWEIAAQRLPWGDVSDKFLLEALLQRLRNEIRPPIDPLWPPGFVQFMCAAWATLPDSRPTFAAAVEQLSLQRLGIRNSQLVDKDSTDV